MMNDNSAVTTEQMGFVPSIRYLPFLSVLHTFVLTSPL